jgi:hypothetical protein
MVAHSSSPSSLLAAFHTLSCDALGQAAAAVDSSLSCIRDLAACQLASVALDAPTTTAAPAARRAAKARPLRIMAVTRSNSTPTPETPRVALMRSSSNKSLPHERTHRPPALQLESLAIKKRQANFVSRREQKTKITAVETKRVVDTPMTLQVKSHLDHQDFLSGFFQPATKPAIVTKRKARPTGCSARFRVHHEGMLHPVVCSPKGRRAAGRRRTPRHGSALI